MRVDEGAQPVIADAQHLEQAEGPQRGQGVDDIALGDDAGFVA